MKKIIAVAGRKGIGKTSLCRYLQFRHELLRNNLSYSDGNLINCNERIVQFPETGRTQAFVDKSGILYSINFLNTKDSEIFSFATMVKNISVDVLGMSKSCVFGSEASKNNTTEYFWEKMPIWIRWINSKNRSIKIGDSEVDYSDGIVGKISNEIDLWNFCSANQGFPFNLKNGQMSNREVMQVLGTDIFRNMFDKNVWVKCALSEIEKSKSNFCLIDDMRFDTEAKAVLENGGYIINLTNSSSGGDQHESERGLSDPSIMSHDRVFHVKYCEDIMKKNVSVCSIIDEIIYKKEGCYVGIGE